MGDGPTIYRDDDAPVDGMETPMFKQSYAKIGWIETSHFRETCKKEPSPNNVNPGLINPGWLIVVVPPNSDSHGYWNSIPTIKQPFGVY